jgi:hypothetical protein
MFVGARRTRARRLLDPLRGQRQRDGDGRGPFRLTEGVLEMSESVMVILHWDEDPASALGRYERAVAAWRERFGERSSEPARALAGRSDRGGLVVVNVFATDEEHHAFHSLGDLLEEVGLPRPDVERVVIERGWPERDGGE